ncbi:MAG: heavy metal-binding domain-containing protein [Chitinophagaceae bacterium]
MKKTIILAVAFLITSPSLFSQTKAGRIDTAQHATYYSCHMHPDVVSDKPGKCSKCGMDLSLTKKEQMKAGVTKNYVCPVHMDITKHDPGKCPKCGKKLALSTKEQMKTEVMKIYTCPMHPEVALDKEGNCPKCGTALIEKKQGK